MTHGITDNSVVLISICSSNLQELSFCKGGAVAKGGFADSKDSDKRQTSLQKAKKPKSTCWNGRRGQQHPIFIWIEWRQQKAVQHSIKQVQGSLY